MNKQQIANHINHLWQTTITSSHEYQSVSTFAVVVSVKNSCLYLEILRHEFQSHANSKQHSHLLSTNQETAKIYYLVSTQGKVTGSTVIEVIVSPLN